MTTEDYAAFRDEWIPFNDLNILIEWDIIKEGKSHYLAVVIYQPRHKRILQENVKIHKKDFENWVLYLDNYIHYDVHRDSLIYIEHKWNELWINLTWKDVERMHEND